MSLLSQATAFQVGKIGNDVVRVERCEGHRLPVQPYMWAVRSMGDVLHANGEWEWEPTPSSRDDAFYKTARFATLEDAVAAALAAVERGK